MRRRSIGRLLAVAGLALVMVTGVAISPASAHAMTGSWRTSAHTLCQSGCGTSSGNPVRLWQSILYADGKFGTDKTQIDGSFGTNTRSKTIDWQNDPGRLDWEGKPLVADGVVGPRTWSAAQKFCADTTGSTYTVYTYCGSRFSLTLREHNTSHVWEFINPRTLLWTTTAHS